MANNTNVLYREVQHFRQPLIWIFLVFLSLFSIYGMVQQVILGKPFGDNPAPDIFLIIIVVTTGLGLPILFYIMNLTTEVRTDGLYLRFFPFHLSFRKIGWEGLASCEVRTYSPIREYGGWGLRYGRKGKAYNVSGNRGLQLELSSGERILIGSQHPESLAESLQSVLSTRQF